MLDENRPALQEALLRSRTFDLMSETFHGGRRGNAAVADSLCSHPELFDDELGFGFRCWQRHPRTGLYRQVESRRRYGGGDRVTTVSAWGHRGALQEAA